MALWKNRKQKEELDKTSFTLEDVRAAKKDTACLILTRCLVLRRRYPTEEVSDEQIIHYVANNYHIAIKDGKITEGIGKTGDT